MKNTRTSHSLPSYLIISNIYLCFSSSPSPISAKLRKLHKKSLLTLTLVHANSTALRFVCLTQYFSYDGISYSKLEEIETALCMKKIEREEEKGVILSSNIYPGIPTAYIVYSMTT